MEMNKNISDLPVVMNRITDIFVVDPPNLDHRRRIDRRQVRGAEIVLCLTGVLCPGDGAGYRLEHQYPTQGELGHAPACRE